MPFLLAYRAASERPPMGKGLAPRAGVGRVSMRRSRKGYSLLLTLEQPWQFTPRANRDMLGARQGVISLKEQEPVCC